MSKFYYVGTSGAIIKVKFKSNIKFFFKLGDNVCC